MVTIQILSDGYDRYTLKADSDCLGRRYDNISEAIRVIRPEVENGRKCEIIVKSGDEIIEYQEVQEETVDITTNISQHNIVSIGFTFSDDSGYIKNSESKDFYFAGAIKPQGFIDIPSDKMKQVIEIINKGFVKAEYSNNMLMFYNTKDEVVGSVEIIGGGGSEYTETDPTVPAWAKLPTKPEYSYEEILNTPIGLATEDFVREQVSALVNSAPETLDTLGELAKALQENASVVDAINQAIAQKADKSEIPTNVVDTISDQNITGTKTFDKVLFSKDIALNNTNGDCKKISVGSDINVTKSYGISIGYGNTEGSMDGISIGRYITTNTTNGGSIAIGYNTIIDGDSGIGIGRSAKAGTKGVAIGSGAKSTADSSIQLGKGVNANPNTFQVFDYQMLDASGNIPIERLANVTSLIETSIIGVLNTEV